MVCVCKITWYCSKEKVGWSNDVDGQNLELYRWKQAIKWIPCSSHRRYTDWASIFAAVTSLPAHSNLLLCLCYNALVSTSTSNWKILNYVIHISCARFTKINFFGLDFFFDWKNWHITLFSHICFAIWSLKQKFQRCIKNLFRWNGRRIKYTLGLIMWHKKERGRERDTHMWAYNLKLFGKSSSWTKNKFN